MLTDDQKRKWMRSVLKFLTCYAQEGDEFLDSIVTGGETWFFTTLLNRRNNDAVQEEVMSWFKGQAADFYDSVIQKLVPRLNKCLEYTCDYVEK
jgi:hypothetical protein